MPSFAVDPSHLRHPALTALLTDHLDRNQARALRLRLAPGCAAAALFALALATSLPHPGVLLHWVAAPACLAPAAWAGAREWHLGRRVAARLDEAAAKKVIKTP